jgi:hypothetical protein
MSVALFVFLAKWWSMVGKLGVCVTVCWVPTCGGTKQSFFRFILWQLNVSFHFLNLVTSRRWQLLQQISNALSSTFSVFVVAASMKNYLTWQSSTEGEPVLHVNVELNVALEVNTWEICRGELQLQTVAAVHNQELGYKVFRPFDYSPEVAISYTVFSQDLDFWCWLFWQVYTLPFTMLPLSAVETPGNV